MKLSAKEKETLQQRCLDNLSVSQKDMDTLATHRAKALEAYNQEKYGDEIEGRSQVVTSDVQDTVEWIMPSLIRIFTGGPEIVTCQPNNKHSVDGAKVMQSKLNFDFRHGFLTLHDWFKDALLMRVGAVKYQWKRKKKHRYRKFTDIDEFEYQALKANPKFEIEEEKAIKQEADVSLYSAEDVPLISVHYDVEGYEVSETAGPVVECLPPEECIFKLNSSNMVDTEFFAHKKRIHVNVLKSKYGLTDDDVKEEFDAFRTDQDIIARFKELGGLQFLSDDDHKQFVFIYECYINHYDKKGRKIPYLVTVFGDEVIKSERNTYGRVPVCVLSPIRMAHRVAGRSVYDLMGELQRLRTAMLRIMLDNMYYQNNGVNIINPFRLNEGDLDTQNVPGGNIRTLYDVDPRTVVSPMPVKPFPAWAFQLLEKTEEWGESKSGVGKRNQGLDPSSLSNTKAGAVSQVMGASQQRIELIARVFAETGVKELFEALRDMNLQFFDKPTAIRVNEEWVDINPDELDGDYDIIVDVGVGTGTREYQVSQLTNLLNLTLPAQQLGIVSPENVYNLLKEIYRAMGRKDVDRFITHPSEAGIPPQVVEALLQLLAQGGMDVQGLLAQAQQLATAGQAPASGQPGGQGGGG